MPNELTVLEAPGSLGNPHLILFVEFTSAKAFNDRAVKREYGLPLLACKPCLGKLVILCLQDEPSIFTIRLNLDCWASNTDL